MSDQIHYRNHHDWPRLCEESDGGCGVALTEADRIAGYCTNCGRKLITEREKRTMSTTPQLERFVITEDVDRAEKKRGIVAEIIDLRYPSDGGPVSIAQCFNIQDAKTILRALQLPARF